MSCHHDQLHGAEATHPSHATVAQWHTYPLLLVVYCRSESLALGLRRVTVLLLTVLGLVQCRSGLEMGYEMKGREWDVRDGPRYTEDSMVFTISGHSDGSGLRAR
jgi:hypothetical protein